MTPQVSSRWAKILQDIIAGPGIRDKLIYVDPARTDCVIPFDLLVTRAELPYDIAVTVLEAFRRNWPECLKEAPHFSSVSTAVLIVLIENGLTLMHMPRLPAATEFRFVRAQHSIAGPTATT
jgi:hypothetical protein